MKNTGVGAILVTSLFRLGGGSSFVRTAIATVRLTCVGRSRSRPTSPGLASFGPEKVVVDDVKSDGADRGREQRGLVSRSARRPSDGELPCRQVGLAGSARVHL